MTLFKPKKSSLSCLSLFIYLFFSLFSFTLKSWFFQIQLTIFHEKKNLLILAQNFSRKLRLIVLNYVNQTLLQLVGSTKINGEKNNRFIHSFVKSLSLVFTSDASISTSNIRKLNSVLIISTFC